MRYYAVIDTNVIVSAALPSRSDSPPKRILKAVVEGTIIPIHSKYLLNEYRGVLLREKFHFDKNDVEILVGFLDSVGIMVEPDMGNYDLPDPKDSPIYAVMRSTPEYDPYLVTGNTKHFPKADRIVTPKEMVGILDADGGHDQAR
jgi:putative PIN family toxin of toxin-antitoxin system